MRAVRMLFFICLAAGAAAGYTEKTVTYYRDSTIQLQGALYIPDTEAVGRGRAAVVAIHEGGFSRGSRHCFKQWGARFAEQDMVTMAIDYRLVRQGGAYPEALKDCIEAVRWLKKHADEYGINRDLVFLLGSSAGAYLAVMTSLAYGLPEEIRKGHGSVRNENVNVRGVISSFGLYDWEKISWRGDGFLSRGMEKTASPVNHMDAAEASYLVLAGERDRLFPVREAQRFADALRKAGKKARIYIKPKQDHAGLCDLKSGIGAWSLPLIENFIDDVTNDCNCGRKGEAVDDRRPKAESR